MQTPLRSWSSMGWVSMLSGFTVGGFGTFGRTGGGGAGISS